MILYDFSQPLSTLWWMHGSVMPKVLWVSMICGLNGIIGVFFKDEYNLYMTDTSHEMIGTAVALILVFKCVMAYQHYSVAKQCVYSFMDNVRGLATQMQAHGVCVNEDAAREIINARVNMARHALVCWYSIIMHLRRQPIPPKQNRLFLYIKAVDRPRWDEAVVRPLYCLVLIEEEIARLRDKGIYADAVATMMCANVRKLVDVFGRMEQLLDTPTVPFTYYQFCNWAVHVFVLTAPAAIATHDTYYAACALLSFLVAAVLLGINFMGDLLMEPFGTGIHGMPLERWGSILERELHQYLPFFKFRFSAIPLFVEACEILAPDDPRLLPKTFVIVEESKSMWIPARNKARAAMRLGNRKMRRMREAKDVREREVDMLVRTRPKVEGGGDVAALLAALGAGGLGGGKGKGKYAAQAALDGVGEKDDKKADKEVKGRDTLPAELTSGQGKKAARVPVELAPKPAQQKQAALLAKKFPESNSMQAMLLQIANPRIPEADKNALVALMAAEAEALAAESATKPDA